MDISTQFPGDSTLLVGMNSESIFAHLSTPLIKLMLASKTKTFTSIGVLTVLECDLRKKDQNEVRLLRGGIVLLPIQ